MRDDIILCGVGGQGTVLASRLLSTAAVQRGVPVKAAETIGMAQRGGSVTSHVRIGEGAASPLIARGGANLIMAFEPAEAVRQLAYLKPGGTVVVSNRPIIPVSAVTGGPKYDLDAILAYLHNQVDRLVVVDADRAAQELGSSRVLNVVLLGAALRSGALSMDANDMRDAIKARLPERFWELNLKALDWAH
ncbi:MAG: indolepyruvate oxidoreductase subunit beta [Coriobacteriales bacterium]|nr:indolepyruvate oxidoreductase subunit beta [Coriobacteriales bacterium]